MLPQITEKRLLTVSPVAITTNGTANGVVTVAESALFRVGQDIILKSTNPSINNTYLRIKRIIGGSEIHLGDPKKGIGDRVDVSAFTVTDGSTIEAIEQRRPLIPEQEIERITYEEEPVIARRTILVDKYGVKYDEDNTIHVNIKSSNGNEIEVNDRNQLKVVLDGRVDENNSSSTPLAAGAYFIGTATDTLDYALIFVTVFSDVAGASPISLCTEFSSDGITWRSGDCFQIPANTEKTFSIQPYKRYMRISYYNGGADQTVFDLHTVVKKTNSKPSTHKIGDNVTIEDDTTLNTSVLKTGIYDEFTLENVGIQNPLPVDDSLTYRRDLDLVNSNVGNFTGSLPDLIGRQFTNMVDNTANNPKVIEIRFNRPMETSLIGVVTTMGVGTFSNAKIYGYTHGVGYILLYDESGDGTPKTALLANFSPTIISGVKLEFHTVNPVTISYLGIKRSLPTTSRIQGLKPDGTVADFQATASGNFKMSLEELENTISSNGNTQLNVTNFDSLGNEGNLISGLNYVAGNEGIDFMTMNLTTINQEHHEIHNGDHYNICDYALNQASGAIIEFVMTTPATGPNIHLTLGVSSSSGATIELFEGTAGVTGGTALTPRNNNRESIKTSLTTVIKDPTTITSDGTRASGYLAGGNRFGGFLQREREFVLAKNQSYLIRITSLAVSNDISWCSEWYEHITIH